MSPWRWVELKPEIPPKPQTSAQLQCRGAAGQPQPATPLAGSGQATSPPGYGYSIFSFIFFLPAPAEYCQHAQCSLWMGSLQQTLQ